MIKVFLIAGEPSGDRLGAALMQGLKDLTGGQVTFEGIGGPLMAEQGLTSLFPIDEIAIMGIVEILSKYPALKARIDQSAKAVLKAQPDVLVTIDLPEFCLRVTKQVKAASAIRCVHYVAPTVWAWRKGRAQKMARHIDQVLALFPFEPQHMHAVGLPCDFVGHPVVTEPGADPEDVARMRGELGSGPIVLVLPGSRRSEVERLAPVFGEVLARLVPRHPQLKVIVPVAPSVADMVRAQVSSWSAQVTLVDSADLARKRAAFAAADVALAASGTVSLELAAAQTPMVIAYDMAWLSRQIIGRMLRVDTVTLVNLVSETRAVPEFIGNKCRPELITPALEAVLADPKGQVDAMTQTMLRLGQGDEPPGRRAARAVLSGLGRDGH